MISSGPSNARRAVTEWWGIGWGIVINGLMKWACLWARIITYWRRHVVDDMLLYSQSCTPYFIENTDTHKREIHGQSCSILLLYIHSQPCWHVGAFDNMHTSIHNPVSLFMLSFHFWFSLLMFFNGLRHCFRFVRRILCCRSRLLDPAEAQKLWVDWTYRSLWRAKRFAQRKDFHLAGEIRKCNKARCRTALTVNQ